MPQSDINISNSAGSTSAVEPPKAVINGRALISLNQASFIRNAVFENMRIDGRQSYDFRHIIFESNTSHLNSFVEVRLGLSRVIVTVSSEIRSPFHDRPAEGIIIFQTEFSPMSSSLNNQNISISKQSDRAIEINRIIERCIRGTRALDVEGLCIMAGEQVFCIRVDIRIIDDDGNLIDCAVLATMTALQHFRRPDFNIVEGRVKVLPLSDSQPIPLSLHHIPICITFAFLKNGSLFIIDPTLCEEEISEGSITIAVNNFNEVCMIHKPGGISISSEKIIECINIAISKVKDLTSQMQQSLEQRDQETHLETRVRTLHIDEERINLKKLG